MRIPAGEIQPNQVKQNAGGDANYENQKKRHDWVSGAHGTGPLEFAYFTALLQAGNPHALKCIGPPEASLELIQINERASRTDSLNFLND